MLILGEALTWPIAGAEGVNELYRRFQDPPREYTARPYWFWNGKLDAAEIRRQIDLMIEQKVYGAIIFPFVGLETPYLSEEWFAAFQVAVDKARETGFLLGFADEHNWPSGEARDHWSKNILQSRVLERDPSLRMKTFACVEKAYEGPRKVTLDLAAKPEVVVAARKAGANSLDYATLQDLTSRWTGGRWQWNVPAGEWSIFVFTLRNGEGIDGGRIDPMNPRAMELFLKLVYEEYYRRFGRDFGKTIQLAVTDTEGDYGERLAWTPLLFDTFRKRKGYDLRPHLPVLFREAGPKTEKVRCDYMDVITHLYSSVYAGIVTEWCERRGLRRLGSFWEDSLQRQTDAMGDFFTVARAVSIPEVDGLYEVGRYPRDYKESRTVALMKGTRYAIEQQAIQGNMSFQSLQRIKLVANMFATWGLNLFIPLFNYDHDKITYHADWFYHQPWFKYFHHYADYIRRVSYMNSEGRHVAEVAVLCPIESMWTKAGNLFDPTRPEAGVLPSHRDPGVWSREAQELELAYANLFAGLQRAGWDFDPLDSTYMLQTRLEGNKLRLGPQSYGALILPPVSTIRRGVMERIKAFYEAGGTVIAMERLPEASAEDGRDDPELRRLVKAVFGGAPQAGAPRENAHGGRAYLVKGDFYLPERLTFGKFLDVSEGGKDFVWPADISPIPAILDGKLEKDARVVEGEQRNFYYLHRQKMGTDYYWVTNDYEKGRKLRVEFRVAGTPVRWDAASGREEPLRFLRRGKRTLVTLDFAPWDAFYVVFRPGISGGGKVKEREPAGLAPLVLGTGWRFRPEGQEVPVVTARVARESDGLGEARGWAAPGISDRPWPEAWFAPENFSIREWRLMGPFPNKDHQGYVEAYPPERGVALGDVHEAGPAKLRWVKETTATHYIDLNQVLSAQRLWGAVGYLFTRVHSPMECGASLIVSAPNAKAWMNGEQVMAFHEFPPYLEMRDMWAHKAPIRLRSGWNTLLVKVEKDRGDFRAMVRVADTTGGVLRGVVYSPEGKLPVEAITTTWYRLIAPPGASAMMMPRLAHPARVFVDGQMMRPEAGKVAVPPGRNAVVALAVDGRDEVSEALRFPVATSDIDLGSLTGTALEHFAGSVLYETDFEIPAEYLRHKLELDPGEVGVVVEGWLNGKALGERVWKPLTFDITGAARSGRNHLRLRVTNSNAGERAVGDRAQYLKNIDLNGLLGPVRVIAYKEFERTAAEEVQTGGS